MRAAVCCLSLSFLFISCTVYKAQIPGYFDDDRAYVNTYVGFRVHLPDDWNIGTSPATATPGLRKVFRSMQTKSSELLFIGLNKTSRCGIRCIAESNTAPINDYFKALYLNNEQNVTTVEADYFSDDNQEVIVWSYYNNVGQMKYRFSDYIFPCGKLRVRLSFWTLASLYDDYVPVFETMLRTMQLSAPESDSVHGWNDSSLYSAIEHPVESHTIDFATSSKEIAALSDGSDTICGTSDRSLLWKVTGGPHTCWLFGSIHVLKPELYPLKPVIEAAFDSSGSLVLELDGESPENTKKIAKMLQAGVFTGDSTMRQAVSTQLYDSMLLYLEKWNIPAQRFYRLRPWMAALILQQLQLQVLGFSQEYGVEKHFMNEKGKRDILELETVEEQAELFTSIDGGEFLSHTLYEINGTEKNLRQMIAAWSCGNAEALNKLFMEDDPDTPDELLEKILYSRNEKMAAKIKTFIEQGKSCFVVVGSAHLVGERSVVDYLQRAGYTVEQM